MKICGLTSVADALSAADAGAHWLGLNFHPPSPRFIEEPTARSIVETLPAGVDAVGLFVNSARNEILATAQRVGFGIVQLHGDEPAEMVRNLRLEGLQVVRAFRLGDVLAIGRMVAWLQQADEIDARPDAVLVDAYAATAFGGTGHSISDELLDLLSPRQIGFAGITRLILAGGLTPKNVAPRVQRVRPWMVDTASGVESAPGCKDSRLMAAFVRSARAEASYTSRGDVAP